MSSRKTIHIPKYAVGFLFKFKSSEEKDEFITSEEFKSLIADANVIGLKKKIKFIPFWNP